MPGLYLLDFNLEGASSFKACREIRRINPFNVIYILSNNMDETNIGYAKANGANGVLKKSAAVILQTISEFLAKNPPEQHQKAQDVPLKSDLNGELKALRTLATFYLGPIADFMFDEFIQQNLSTGQMVKKISEQLDGKEKVKFLNEARQFI
jgi:DNA-binding NarL/FixJ family response regulator